MRCLAIADAITRRRGTCVFAVTTDREVIVQQIRARGHDAQVSRHPVGTGDLAELARIRERYDCSAVVVDSYAARACYFSELRSMFCRVAVLDDMGTRTLPVDVVIHPGPSLTSSHYPDAKRHLIGVGYAPLRREFLAHPRGVRVSRGPSCTRVPRVLIMFGGSDPARGAARILSALPSATSVIATVCVGALYEDEGQLARAVCEATDRGHTVEIVRACRNVARLMALSDFAVVAGGSTLWELAYFGVPTAAFVVSDNQEPAVSALVAQRCILGGRRLQEIDDCDITSTVDALLGEEAAQIALSRRFGALVDGLGAERIAAALECGS